LDDGAVFVERHLPGNGYSLEFQALWQSSAHYKRALVLEDEQIPPVRAANESVVDRLTGLVGKQDRTAGYVVAAILKNDEGCGAWEVVACEVFLVADRSNDAIRALSVESR